MRRLGAVAACLAILAGPANAQDSPSTTAPPTAPPGLKSGSGQNGDLLVLSGDRVVLRLSEDFKPIIDHVEHPAAATAQSGPMGDVPDGEIALTLSFDPKLGSLLLVQSRASTQLRYQALMLIDRDGRLMVGPTSTCPVRPGVADFENWPSPLVGVVIKSFSAPAPGDTACRQ